MVVILFSSVQIFVIGSDLNGGWWGSAAGAALAYLGTKCLEVATGEIQSARTA